MNIKPSLIQGVYEIENRIFKDQRGEFVKTFHADQFESHGLDIDFKESFYSVSRKNVIRGMHFQLPPFDHSKLVYVVDGEILDVVVDVRRGAETFGRYFFARLSSENAKSLYMSKGFAHGFLTLSEQATVVYLTTTVHSLSHDAGIRWDSFGFDWLGVDQPIVSDRDKAFSPLII